METYAPHGFDEDVPVRAALKRWDEMLRTDQFHVQMQALLDGLDVVKDVIARG